MKYLLLAVSLLILLACGAPSTPEVTTSPTNPFDITTGFCKTYTAAVTGGYFVASFINDHAKDLIEDPEQVFTDPKWRKEHLELDDFVSKRIDKFELVEYSEHTEPLREQVDMVSGMFWRMAIVYFKALDNIEEAENEAQVIVFVNNLNDNIETLVDETVSDTPELTRYISLYCSA